MVDVNNIKKGYEDYEASGKFLLLVGFLVILFLLVASNVSGLTGTSASYSMDAKVDTGASATNASSASFLQRFIMGIREVGEYVSASFAGRFGILGVEADVTVSVTACRALNQTNTIYNLTQDVSGTGTCFTVSANNVSLQCNGYMINYSQTTTGYGVTANGYNNTHISNCTIVQGNTTGKNSYAIYFRNAGGADIRNNTVWTFGPTTTNARNYGIHFYKYKNSSVLNNNFTTSGRNSYPIYLRVNSNTTNVSSNEIYTSGRYSRGIYVYRTGLTSIQGNNVTTSGISASDVFLYQAKDNNVTYNNLSATGRNTHPVFVRGGAVTPTRNKINYNEISAYGRSARAITLYRGVLSTEVKENRIKTNATNSFGIYLQRHANATLIDYNNITMEGSGGYGMRLYAYSDYNNITYNNISAVGTSINGIFLSQFCDYNYVINNTVESNRRALYISRASNSKIYNNIFNSTSRRLVSAGTRNADNNELNRSQATITNIIGGTEIGGNFWVNSLGTGFSQTCKDYDVDGICDEDYKINNKHIDYLPLTDTDTVNPKVSLWSPDNETFVNGRVSLIANATDNFNVENVVFQYDNSSINWTNIPNCNFTSPNYNNREDYRCFWRTGDYSDDSEGYHIRVVAYDSQGNNGTDFKHYNIDRTRPIIYEMEVDYPFEQDSAKNEQNITLLSVVVTDSPTVAAGIYTVEADITNINGTSWSNMTIVSGSKASGHNSTWHLNVTVNTTTGRKRVKIRVLDAASPKHNRQGDRWRVQVDNDVPQYTLLGSTINPYNNTVAVFSVRATDNFDLDHYILSTNWSGTWTNESNVSVSGTVEYVEHEKTVYEGNMSYMFLIYDDSGNLNQTTLGNIEVLGNEPVFTIYLDSPDNGLLTNQQTINFSYYYVNGDADNCSIFINEILNITKPSPANDTLLNFTAVLGQNNYSWYIDCFQNETIGEDNVTVQYISDTRDLTVDTSVPLITVNNPLNMTYNDTYIPFNITLNENSSWCGVSVDSAANLTMTRKNDTYFHYTQKGLATGSHNVVFSCNDSANNFNNTAPLFFFIKFPIISINMTYPNESRQIVRGNDTLSNEDDLGLVTDTMQIISRVYNDSFGGVSGATCYFYNNLTYIDYDYTNSSGHCNITFDKSGLDVMSHPINVNYTYVSPNVLKNINSTNSNYTLIRYNIPRFAGNKGAAASYAHEQTAILYFNITKVDSSGTTFYDPQNISVNATDSSGNQYPVNEYVAASKLVKNAVGQYESHVVVNRSIDTLIKWNIYISDDGMSTYVGTSLHGDVGISLPPVCGNNILETGEACDDGNLAGGDGCSATCTTEGGTTDTGGGDDGDTEEPVCDEQWVCTEWTPCDELTRTQSKICNELECGGGTRTEERECLPCDPDWGCEWTPCDESGFRDYLCVDQNGCGIDEGKPAERSAECECAPEWNCEPWEECGVDYDFDDVIKGRPVVGGKVSRLCNDITGCSEDKVEYQNCSMAVPVRIEKVNWCEQEYLEVYEIKTDKLVSRIKESSIGENRILDIGFIASNFIGYCDYCYNNVKDYDETGMDCGGPNCPECIIIEPFRDYYRWLIWLLWFLIILYLLILWLILKRRKEEKKKPKKKPRVKRPKVRRARRIRIGLPRFVIIRNIFSGINRSAERFEQRIAQAFRFRRARRVERRRVRTARKARRKSIRLGAIEIKKVKKAKKREVKRKRRLFRTARRRAKREGRREYRVIRKKVRKRAPTDTEIAALERRLREWKKAGYSGTEQLEAKLRKLKASRR